MKLKSRMIKWLSLKGLVILKEIFIYFIGSKRGSIKKNTKVKKSRKNDVHIDIDPVETQ